MLNHLGVWSGIAGLAVALIFGVGPHMGFKMPRWLARTGLITGIALLLASPLIFFFGEDQSAPAVLISGDRNIVGNSGIAITGDNNVVAPLRESDAFYVGKDKVGKANPPIQTGNVVTFTNPTFSAFIDPKSTIEYGNLILQCPNMPTPPRPGMVAASTSIAIAGSFNCNIVGRK